MNNNSIQTNQMCPVCHSFMIEAPNGVCSVCHGKHKKMYEHSSFMSNEWTKISQNGLSAVEVLIDILDNIDADTGTDADIIWHRRRVYFMKDMVEQLGLNYFAPATSQQIFDFTQSAIDFWNDKISHREAKDKYDSMTRILQKKDITQWDSKSFLLWMIQEREDFDWIWDQWFECLHNCIPERCNDNIWISLLVQHFSEEINAWVNDDN